MSEKKETLDPEIWTLSVIGDVYGFIDEAFSDIPVTEQDVLKDFLDGATFDNPLYIGVKERLLENLWDKKASYHEKNRSIQ
ncbi:MAG: hypothetical protein CMM15_01835 [Rhodospirillaceae bacterium]|nr:hypothetical protein [Rhodospirillaceae bacterium]OUU29045.1 MAG: hypothetical protein CBB97_03155 [Candidatus Endolissoclinum sp. TMED37]